MPTVSRLFVKTAMIYLVLSLLAGAALLLEEGGLLPPATQALRPVFYHLFLLGWATQLIFGVAWWMFPPLSTAAKRGPEGRMLLVYALLNLGLALRAVAEPSLALGLGGSWSVALISSAALQVAGVWIFAVELWPRVRATTPRPGA